MKDYLCHRDLHSLEKKIGSLLIYLQNTNNESFNRNSDPGMSNQVKKEESRALLRHIHRHDLEEYVDFNREVPLIWVGGVPRSGTTLARAMLDAHPDIRCGEETRVIPRILGTHKAMMASSKESARLLEAKVTNKILNDAMGAYILTVIAGHGEPAPRLCNKDPFTLKSINKIMEIFPNSKFMLMVRDGRATCHSIISRKVTIRGFDFKTYKGCLRDWNRAAEDMFNKCSQVDQPF